MRWGKKIGWILSAVALLAVAGPIAASADSLEKEATEIINERCAPCHAARSGGGWEHISDQRKTPEGWDMNIIRMYLWHRIQVPSHDRQVMVKYLSDIQGLAPEETAGWRYILERRPNHIEAGPDETIGVMCARCHSYARVALQRRDTDSWLKLSHMHVGQIPTIEYHALARDRNWWEIASQDVPKILGKAYPMKTAAWKAWQGKRKADFAGQWTVSGHQPGKGAYAGQATITRTAADEYTVNYTLHFEDGGKVGGVGTSIVYTGYEWRGSAKLGSDNVNEVYGASADGNTISGRWFVPDAEEIGGDLTMTRIKGSAISAVIPSHLRSGQSAEVTVYGAKLSGKVNLGPGVSVGKVVSSDGNHITVMAKASGNTQVNNVSVGSAKGSGMFTVYKQVDSVQVEPGFAITRVGGGTTAAVAAQLEAVGFANGADGKAGTDDDIRIGVMSAGWVVKNLNETATAMKDDKYSGMIQSNGLFMPNFAGPNSERKYKTNNAGELAVVATVNDGGREVTGQATLVATVQRWNNPPIR